MLQTNVNDADWEYEEVILEKVSMVYIVMLIVMVIHAYTQVDVVLAVVC